MSIKGNGKYTLRCYSGGDRWGSGPFSNTSVVFGKHTTAVRHSLRGSVWSPLQIPRSEGMLKSPYIKWCGIVGPLYPRVAFVSTGQLSHL